MTLFHTELTNKIRLYPREDTWVKNDVVKMRSGFSKLEGAVK